MKEKNRIRLEAAEFAAMLLSDHLQPDAKTHLDCPSCARAIREWILARGEAEQ